MPETENDYEPIYALMNLTEITRIQAEADLIYSSTEVEIAIAKMAEKISIVLKDKNPIVICLMVGGIILTGKLLPLLGFPLQVEYLHATRYQGEISGNTLHWIKKSTFPLQGRNVLIIDDILDEGTTLASVVWACEKHQAKTIQTAVLVDKQLNRERDFKKADFTGLLVPNRYIFGYGMDYKEYLRNAPGIYAVKA